MLLGEGSFGFVSLAKSSGLGDNFELELELPPLFAVKSAELGRSSPLQYEREVLHEFRDCSNVIRCYGADASEEDGVILYNLMLEYAAGGSLADRIYGGKSGFLEDEVRTYTKSVLMGLSCIHRKGFAHCDIKPDNILLVDDGPGMSVAKIGDFGLAKRVRKSSKQRRRKRGSRGTLAYMAPESILFGEYGCGVDVWGLGCTVVEMLTDKRLWDFNPKAEGKDAFLKRIVNQEVEIPQGLSWDARDFLEKCLIKNPVLRWTADMLLGHTFVSCLEEETSLIGTVSEASTVSSSRVHDDESSEEESDWIMKPLLLLNPLCLQ